MTPDDAPLDDQTLESFAARLEDLPLDTADWVLPLFLECRRARAAEAALRASAGDTTATPDIPGDDIAQIVLDTAEWLKTLWDVGYMGAGRFPTTPRSEFPAIEVEDILKSALLSRIRKGRRPLPFPPPTRQGIPWHDVVDGSASFAVDALIIRDENGAPLAASIEGCNDWQLVSVSGEMSPDFELVVQHAGKGPLYRLRFDAQGRSLTREPPSLRCRISAKRRAGTTAWLLEWPRPGAAPLSVPLRAATWERAESEASYWIAGHHPERYGQVDFERHED